MGSTTRLSVVTGVDLVRLGEWMDGQGLPRGEIVDVESLGGGTQNILLRFCRGDGTYVLRHPPPHKRANSDETMRREARVLGAPGLRTLVRLAYRAAARYRGGLARWL